MAFIETPRFPDNVSYGAVGGPEFSTDVVVLNSGFEQRNSNWAAPRGQWDVSHGARTKAEQRALLNFFRAVGGRRDGFRFKDWSDYQAETGEGVFLALTSTTFQMRKAYAAGSTTVYRTIVKPVSGTISITGGTGATVDYTTGIVTVSSGTPTAWTGEFDVPARFDIDKMACAVIDHGIYQWQSIPVVEIRT